MNKDSKIYIAGHKGMVGSAIERQLKALGYTHIIGRSSKELDLRNDQAVRDFFSNERPKVVIDAAAKVGGILANHHHPYSFLMDNLKIQNNLISSSIEFDVDKFIFLGSSCIYPKLAPQPLKEEYLLTGPLEPTNQWYAMAKITGVKAIEAVRKNYGKDYVALMPTNLYGPFDNFDLSTSHVLPALLRKFHQAKSMEPACSDPVQSVELWGTGTPLREFLHVDDLAAAVVFAIENTLPEHLYNVGSGHELKISELASLIQFIVGHNGNLTYDSNKPDGTPRKLMDSSKFMSLGWKPKITLEEGLKSTYAWFLQNLDSYKQVKM
jgi:GDP-L-fucose synthase